MGNYYEDQTIHSVERAILTSSIGLPKCIWDYADTTGTFEIPILTPGGATGTQKTPSTKGHKGETLNVKSFSTSNTVSLVIPRYILLNFIGTVPGGTQFLVASAGGTMDIDDMAIIGLFYG